MQKVYRKLITLITNGWAWWLDYAYVIFWQLHSFFIRTKPSRYKVNAIEKSKDEKTAIILIPGVYENWRFMKPVADTLYRSGYPIHIIDGLGYNVGSIEEMAAVISNYIKTDSSKKYFIVAHSKGGLVGKYLLAHDNLDARFKGMVAINTPFSGSRYATYVPLKTVRIFLPNSPILTGLSNSTKINKNIISIYGQFDPHIPEGSYLKGATNIQLPIRGHFKVLANSRLLDEVLKYI